MSSAETLSAGNAVPCAESAESAQRVDGVAVPPADASAPKGPPPAEAPPAEAPPAEALPAEALPGGSSSGASRDPSGEQTFVSQSPPFPSPTTAAPSPLAVSLIGQRLDHYELQEFVGGGGMGLVFRALDTALGRPVAVKILSTDRSVDEETVRRFRNEAQSAARLDHDHIARVYYVGQAGGLNYIVFEYIEGKNLRDMVGQRGPLPLELVLSYSLQIASALVHASDRGVVHRDIKPSNVLITRQGRAKLVDMGLSRLQLPDSDEDLTASGVTLGTFDYISPEQARDPRSADVRSDIYSLGCTIYFLLTAQPPFPSGNAMQKLLQHHGNAPPDPAELNPAVPAELSRVVRKALAKDPGRRYQEPRELIADLSLLASDLNLELPNVGVELLVTGPSRLAQLTRRHVPWLVPLAAMIAAVIVLDQMWASQQRELQRALPLGQAEVRAVGDGATSPPATKEKPPLSAPPRKALPLETIASQSNPGTTASLPVESAVDHPARIALRGANFALRRAGGLETDRRPSGGLKIGGGGGELAAGFVESGEPTSARLGPGDPVNTVVSAPPPTVSANHVLYVDPATRGGIPHEFATLKAALEAVKSGGTIELRFTGRHDEPPAKLANVPNVTVKAAEGYQPVLVFRPGTNTDASVYPRNMLSLTSAQLTMLNVALELSSPPATTKDGWGLFALFRSQLDLKRCTLTIVNQGADHRALHKDVNFFEVLGESSTGAMMMTSDMPTVENSPVSVRLRDCVVRGEAMLVDAGHSLYPIELTWNNGLLAISEPLFRSLGGRMAPRGGRFSIELDQVTAHLRGGLCYLTSGPGNSHQLQTHVRCTNSLLLGRPECPLVYQEGDDTLANLKSKFVWSGAKHLYDGFAMYWRLMDLDGTRLPAVEDMMLADWQNHWSSAESPVPGPTGRPMRWQSLPEESRPLHQHVPGDYKLRSDSPAIRNRTEGDVGGQLGSLPPPPPEEEAATLKEPAEKGD
jgi:serine/threonine protein kinase